MESHNEQLSHGIGFCCELLMVLVRLLLEPASLCMSNAMAFLLYYHDKHFIWLRHYWYCFSKQSSVVFESLIWKTKSGGKAFLQLSIMQHLQIATKKASLQAHDLAWSRKHHLLILYFVTTYNEKPKQAKILLMAAYTRKVGCLLFV